MRHYKNVHTSVLSTVCPPVAGNSASVEKDSRLTTTELIRDNDNNFADLRRS